MSFLRSRFLCRGFFELISLAADRLQLFEHCGSVMVWFENPDADVMPSSSDSYSAEPGDDDVNDDVGNGPSGHNGAASSSRPAAPADRPRVRSLVRSRSPRRDMCDDAFVSGIRPADTKLMAFRAVPTPCRALGRHLYATSCTSGEQAMWMPDMCDDALLERHPTPLAFSPSPPLPTVSCF